MSSTEKLRMEFDKEKDGRWIAEIPDLLGVMAYGATQEEARNKAEAIAVRTLADRHEHGELTTKGVSKAVDLYSLLTKILYMKKYLVEANESFVSKICSLSQCVTERYVRYGRDTTHVASSNTD